MNWSLVLGIIVLILVLWDIFKIRKLKERLNNLDSESISEKVSQEINRLQQAIANGENKLRMIVQEELREFNDRLDKNEKEVWAQKEKLNNLRSAIKENGKKVLADIFRVVEETFGPIFEKESEEETGTSS